MPCPLLTWRRQYHTLDEDERDPEEGNFSPTAASAGGGSGGGALVPARGALSGGAGGTAGATVELSTVNGSGATGQIKSIDMGVCTNRGDYPRGLTTPQKLQRSASNSEEAAAVAAVLGGNSTPRNAGAQSPLRSTAPRQGL
jgi:hypothetical protein